MGNDDFASMVIENLLRSGHELKPDKGLAIAQLLLTEGPAFDVELLLDIAEAIMQLSANAGSSLNRKYLDEEWDKLRIEHRERLLRVIARIEN